MNITAVKARSLNIEVSPELAIVSSLGKHRVSEYVVVIIETDAGTVGLGEANVVPIWSGESQGSALAAIEGVLAREMVGQNPLYISELRDRMEHALVGNPFAKASLEMALFDLTGKALGAPVHTLLGGPRRSFEIPLRFSIGAFSPSKAAEVAERAAARGLKAVKVKVGLGVSEDIRRVEAVRQALGESFPVGVDANGGWTENEAVSAVSHLERLRVNVIEEPLRRSDFPACARLRNRTQIPLMLDESIFTPHNALNAIRQNACDIISIYPGKNGGIGRSFEIATLVAAAGLECTIGSNLEWEIGSAAMLHLAVAIPNLSQRVGHDIIGPLYHTRHVGTPLRFENGCAAVPPGPGLGIELDPSC